MIIFLFSALIAALDQFFKHYVSRTIPLPTVGLAEGPVLIPGVLGLTRLENDGAMLNILSGQQWLLAGIAFIAAVVLIMILLRYNEGFWGSLGLAAVLGGTVGNLIDRIFNDGKVVDMFRTLFINFPIFNIADVFITLGFATFLAHFIYLTFKPSNKDGVLDANGSDDVEYIAEPDDIIYEEEVQVSPIPADYATVATIEAPVSQAYAQPVQAVSSQPEPSANVDESSDMSLESIMKEYESTTDTTPDISFTMEAIEAELGSLDDINLDDVLREYGLDDDTI
ncbi:MAG: signal peptidase II [Oscillospiraceae bacterium]|jgi:signal peptidase II|nr:signal peptidase II [Oscillospiraceae bacterium]